MKKRVVQDFLIAKNSLMQYFNCKDNYFVKTLVNFNWQVNTNEGITFLTYWDSNLNKTNAVVVKKSGTPLIYKGRDYTMIVAIDCIKVAFIFKNINELL